MRIVIQARGFDLTAGLREHVERRIHFAFDWASYHVRRISVRLSDVNGPRGGEDKCCHIQVTIAGTVDLVIEDIEADLHVAIDRAADRAKRALARQIQRQREHLRGRLRATIDVRPTSLMVEAGIITSAISDR